MHNAVTGLCAYLVDRGCGFLESYINDDESAVLLLINSPPLYSLLSPPTIPTSDIMSSSNNVRPSLYVSTTPVDQEGEVPVTWNMMRNNVQPMLLEVSGVFQQSMLIVS